MEFTRGNRAVRDHAHNGKDLLVFQSSGKGRGDRFLGDVYARAGPSSVSPWRICHRCASEFARLAGHPSGDKIDLAEPPMVPTPWRCPGSCGIVDLGRRSRLCRGRPFTGLRAHKNPCL
jgi:hypothetical protein